MKNNYQKLFSDKVQKIVYGGDYNPEQWPEEIWAEDMRLFHLCHIDIVTLNVFSWASLQSDEHTYHFEKLDKIMALAKENNLFVCLATSTGAHPSWMAKKYPDILRTDYHGMKRKYGCRHNSCPNSPTYKKYSVELAKRLAERYKDYDNIVAWHVSNEFSGNCYCDNCRDAFRIWLKNKYHDIDALNKAWNTGFWSHTFYDFDEIEVPNLLSEQYDGYETAFEGLSLDYDRFMSDSIMNCYIAESDVLKSITPQIPVTTNFMVFFKGLNYRKWAPNMDFISWDCYPNRLMTPSYVSMNHDVFRGLKQGMPFALMEQAPSSVNWQYHNTLKRPGVMRLHSYQAVAHGADTVMFFQLRQSIGASEKFHSAVISHAGHENTRVFRELTALGKELTTLGDKILGTRFNSKAAIYLDWENWWAIDYIQGFNKDMNYIDECLKYYTALNKRNISVDIIGADDELTDYDIVFYPMMYMTKDGYEKKMEDYVAQGGNVVVTYLSGLVDENPLVITGGYPGKLRPLLGIWVEESEVMLPDEHNHFVYNKKEYPVNLMCDIIHLEGAVSLSEYTEDFYQGTPAVTRHSYGKGKAYYVGVSSDDVFYDDFVKDLQADCNIPSVYEVPAGVEATLRRNDRFNYIFLLNHNKAEVSITISSDCTDLLGSRLLHAGDTITLAPYDVIILEETL